MSFKKVLTVIILILPTLCFSVEKVDSISPFVNFYVGAGAAFNNQLFLGDYLDGSEGTHHWVNFGNYGVSGKFYVGFNKGLSANSMLGCTRTD